MKAPVPAPKGLNTPNDMVTCTFYVTVGPARGTTYAKTTAVSAIQFLGAQKTKPVGTQPAGAQTVEVTLELPRALFDLKAKVGVTLPPAVVANAVANLKKIEQQLV